MHHRWWQQSCAHSNKHQSSKEMVFCLHSAIVAWAIRPKNEDVMRRAVL
jgi:hypothetical protein